MTRWRLQRVVGRGRHSSVWLAGDLERGTPVALKVSGASLWPEWETLNALDGQCVAKAIDHGSLPDGRSYLALEYLPAQAPRPVALWLAQAAATLASIHRHGWVHRDLKPAHWLPRAGGGMALCDFGSACRFRQGRHGGEPRVTGSPRYAAPEQTQGAAATPAADVYSLGACVFELLAGKPPFSGESLIEVFSQHVRAPVPRLSPTLGHWQPLVDAMLAKDPKDRPADGAAVLALARQVSGEAV